MECLLPWFALKTVPGIGDILFKRLIDHFKTPELVFQASSEHLIQVEGVSRRLAAKIKGHKLPEWVKPDLDLVVKHGYAVITMADANYPALLHEIPDPPPFLYVYGTLTDSVPYIALVGARNATAYGVAVARQLGADLASLGIAIVSGMARGIDTAAHMGALQAGGRTVAILGNGLNKIYPAENHKLYHQIAEHGAVMSELPVLSEPEAHNFPRRNRIISGMSLGTVVVEAARKSGSLITARLAADQGREVFAVPGSIKSFKSAGSHSLIKQGAKLVESASDVLEEFAYLSGGRPVHDRRAPDHGQHEPPQLSADEALVLSVLEPYPAPIDELVHKLTMAPGKVASILLQLELRGIVYQSPGNRFSTHEDQS